MMADVSITEVNPVPMLYSKHGGKSLDENLLEPFVYICGSSRKDLRARMLKAYDNWFNLPKQHLEFVQSAMNTTYHAALLVDDIQDHSTLRRGLPTAHLVYNIPIALNAAFYYLCVLIEKSFDTDIPEFYEILSEIIVDVIRGQGSEIYWRDTFTCPTEEEYLEMANQKTGQLFVLITQLMQHLSTRKEDFSKLSEKIGLFFQISNDYQSLKSEAFFGNKTYCEDITEGKFSFPIIHAIQSHPNDKRLLRILRQRPTDLNTKKLFVSILEEFGSFEYTRNKLAKLREELKVELDKYERNPQLEVFINEMFELKVDDP